MDTIIIRNTVDKTQIILEESQQGESWNNKSNRIKDWIVGEKLNTNSAQAEIYYVKNSHTGKKAILKIYRRTNKVNLSIYEKVKKINNSHVVKIYDYGIKDNHPFVIEELLDGDSLENTLIPLSEKNLWKLVYNINSGLRAIHNCGIIHRDMKPSNIIFCNGRYVITDFGISIFKKEKSADYSHTVGYNAPELFLNEYSSYYDYYALGLIIYYAITGNKAFENRGKEFIYRDQLENFTVKNLLSTKEVIALTDRVKKLLIGLITNDVEYRWGFFEVLKWLYFLPINNKQKFYCTLDFDYRIHTKEEFFEVLNNFPEVVVKALKEEEISLYEFLNSVSAKKTKRLYKKIQNLKNRSQKQYVNWIYDQYFDIKLIKLTKKIFDFTTSPPHKNKKNRVIM